MPAVTPYDAALVNGTAAHGEDFDDTFEGGPVHAGAVVVPAVLAAAELRRSRWRGRRAGVAVGTELMCRMSLVAPQAIHKAGFHPTAVIGAPAAAAAVAPRSALDPRRSPVALGISGSLSSASSNTCRRQLDEAARTPARRPSGAQGGAPRRSRLRRPADRCSKARTASTRRSRLEGSRFRAAPRPARGDGGPWRRSPSSPTPAEP